MIEFIEEIYPVDEKRIKLAIERTLRKRDTYAPVTLKTTIYKDAIVLAEYARSIQYVPTVREEDS